MSRQFTVFTGIASALTFGSVWLLSGPAASLDGPASSPPSAASLDAPASSSPPSNVYYPRCDAARAAGAAPIYAGQPGYRSALDRDGDGIACEPYNGGGYP